MRIDPKGTVAGWPALLVRRTLRQLRTRLQWGLGELEPAASVEEEEGRELIKALLAEGLIEAAGRDACKVTQAGQTLSSATAGKRVTRATAQKGVAAIPWPRGAGQQRPVFPRRGNEGGSFRQHAET